MTTFVNPNLPTEHNGAERLDSAIEAARHLGSGFAGTRGLATLLLSAMAAAVMVVAYQVMDSVTEGHLLVMWIGLWAAAFAALALFASTARSLASRVKSSLDAWSLSLAEARAEQRMWDIARRDPRVMADLDSARLREEAALEETATEPTVNEQDDRLDRMWAARRYYI
jgi:hypothetical protein